MSYQRVISDVINTLSAGDSRAQRSYDLHFRLSLLRTDCPCGINIVRFIQLLSHTGAGLLDQSGWRRLACLVKVGLHRRGALVDHDLIKHALGSSGHRDSGAEQSDRSDKKSEAHVQISRFV